MSRNQNSNVFECIGLVILIIVLIGVFFVMNWKPVEAEAKNPEKITISQKVNRELLGKLPTSKEDKEKEEKEVEEQSQEVASDNYYYSSGSGESYYYYTGGIGGASYTNTNTNVTPNSHTEQNTDSNQAAVELQAQEDAAEQKATEAKITVAEKVLEVVHQTAEIVEQASVGVTDDGTTVTTPVPSNPNQGDGDASFDGEDEREVIEMEVDFGDEGFSYQDPSVDGQTGQTDQNGA